jgi:hypothetical protein
LLDTIRTARAGQPEEDTLKQNKKKRAARAGQPGDDRRNRTESRKNLSTRTGEESQNKTARAGQPEHVGRYRTAQTGKTGQNSHRQDCLDMTARIERL